VKVLLCSSSPPDWKELAELTTATHRRYCERHGYDYYHDVSDMSAPLKSAWKNEKPTGYFPLYGMIRFRLLAHFLDPDACGKEYDVVAWTDADTIVTNYEYDLTQYLPTTDPYIGPHLIIPYDVNGLHPTVLIFRNTLRSRSYLWCLTNVGETMFLAHSWNDNVAQRFFLQTPPFRDMERWVSAQEVCAMPPDTYPIPAEIRRPYEWTPQSWTVHLSAMPLETRIAMAKEWIDRLGLL
jgi:hypothetical protein